MTTALAIAQDKLPEGYRDPDKIEEELILTTSYGSDSPHSLMCQKTLEDMIDSSIKEDGDAIFNHILDKVMSHNEDKMYELATSIIIDQLRDEGLVIEDISGEEFDNRIEEQLMMLVDMYSYNGMIDTEGLLASTLFDKNISYVVRQDGDFAYEHFTSEVPVDVDEDRDVLANHPQCLLFDCDDLYKDDNCYLDLYFCGDSGDYFVQPGGKGCR